MKINVLLLISWSLSAAAWGQDMGFFISASPTFNSGKSDVDQFLSSYNAFFEPQLERPMRSKVGMMTGFTLLGGYHFNGAFEGGFGYGNSFTQTSAHFKNGERQVFKIWQNDYLIDMSFGSNLESPVKVSGNLGMLLRFGKAQMHYVHNDGTKDYQIQYAPGSYVNQLNGYYHGWRLTFYTGLSAGVNLRDGERRLFVRADYVFGTKSSLGVFTDNNPSKQIGLSGSGQRPELPTDVDIYFNGTNSQNIFNGARNNNHGLRIMVTYQFNINL